MYSTLVTICTVQWSLYVPYSGHYMYRTMVTICTVQWSLYVPYNGQYMYRTVITICTVQWSLYVPYNGHYMCRTVVTICTVQWSLYVPYNGHYMYRTVVTICTTSLTFTFLRSAHAVYLCVLCGSENKQRLFHCTTLTGWFLCAFAKLQKVSLCLSVRPSVRPPICNNAAPNKRIFMKLIFENFSKIGEEFQVSLK